MYRSIPAVVAQSWCGCQPSVHDRTQLGAVPGREAGDATSSGPSVAAGVTSGTAVAISSSAFGRLARPLCLMPSSCAYSGERRDDRRNIVTASCHAYTDMRRITSLIAGTAVAVAGLGLNAPSGAAADSGRLLFTRQGPGDDMALWVRDSTGDRILADTDLNERRARWSPDGTHVAFSRFADTETTSDVVVLSADGQELNVGVPGAYDDRPTWSPDGGHIAFLSSRSSDNNSQFGADVYVAQLNPSRTGVVRLAKVVDMKYGVWGVDWAPDGRSLAISGWAEKGGRDIYEIPLADPFTAGTPRNITRSPSPSEDDPEWSPDGSTISFTESAGRSIQVGIVSRDGNGRRILTSGKAQNDSATWSLDGRSLTFGSDRSGKSFDLYTVDISSGAIEALLATDGVGENSADWGPVPPPLVIGDGDGDGDGGGDDDPPVWPVPLPPLG